ncbi:MAG: hypothetical protein WCC48_03235 [Anaeromyxobacteraceae bacterium]
MSIFETASKRFRLVMVWGSATDVRRAVGCSRSTAYEHLSASCGSPRR